MLHCHVGRGLEVDAELAERVLGDAAVPHWISTILFVIYLVNVCVLVVLNVLSTLIQLHQVIGRGG